MRNENFKNKIGNFKSCVGNLKDKMQKILRMCDSTDFKQTEAFEILQDGLINILDIKALNCHIQKVSKNRIFRKLKNCILKK
jgi:hypothetical protein